MSTLNLEARRGVPVYGIAHALAAATIWLVRKPVHFYQSRKLLTQLAAMSDHELSDIGLSRSDVAAATGLPADVDPTAVLAGVAQERRHWRRGA